MDTCPHCEGKGAIFGFGCGSKGPVGLALDCELCEKTGKIDEKRKKWLAAGSGMKDERIAKGLVLRKEAARRGMNPVDLSRMERGIIEPVRG